MVGGTAVRSVPVERTKIISLYREPQIHKEDGELLSIYFGRRHERGRGDEGNLRDGQRSS